MYCKYKVNNIFFKSTTEFACQCGSINYRPLPKAKFKSFQSFKSNKMCLWNTDAPGGNKSLLKIWVISESYLCSASQLTPGLGWYNGQLKLELPVELCADGVGLLNGRHHFQKVVLQEGIVWKQKSRFISTCNTYTVCVLILAGFIFSRN